MLAGPSQSQFVELRQLVVVFLWAGSDNEDGYVVDISGGECAGLG